MPIKSPQGLRLPPQKDTAKWHPTKPSALPSQHPQVEREDVQCRHAYHEKGNSPKAYVSELHAAQIAGHANLHQQMVQPQIILIAAPDAILETEEPR